MSRAARLAAPACLLALAAGCLHPGPAVETGPPLSHAMPHGCRCHVHAFLLDGCDVIDWCGFADYAAGVHDLGYASVRHGYLYHAPFFAAAIRALKDDPAARVVLVAHGTGASGLAPLADAAHEAGVRVTSVVYLDPVFWGHKIATAERTLAVCKKEPPPELASLGLVELVRPEGGAARAATLAVLDRELAAAAAEVPVPSGYLPDPEKEFAPAPTPRPVDPKTETLPPPKGWEFIGPG